MISVVNAQRSTELRFLGSYWLRFSSWPFALVLEDRSNNHYDEVNLTQESDKHAAVLFVVYVPSMY